MRATAAPGRVVVTGGSRGLGLAIARRLLADGWHVVAVARHRSEEVAAIEAKEGDRFQFLALDLARPGAAAELARRACLLEGVDALVANAAVGTEGLLTLSSEAELRACVELNLVSTMLVAREALKGMLARRAGGSLVFVSSVAAQNGFTGLAVYSATKGALLAFSRSLAREYGGRGIRSNCVLPGFLNTEMTATLGAEQRERLRRRTPLGRLGEAEDVSGLVAFLLSPEARQVTGAEFVVDGGLTA